LTVYPSTEETALLAGRIDREETAKGTIIPFSGLLIGATALSLAYWLPNSHARHFRLIPELDVVLL